MLHTKTNQTVMEEQMTVHFPEYGFSPSSLWGQQSKPTQYQQVFKETRDFIKRHLWPDDPVARERITRADFDIMERLSLDTPASEVQQVGPAPLNKDLYEIEDFDVFNIDLLHEWDSFVFTALRYADSEFLSVNNPKGSQSFFDSQLDKAKGDCEVLIHNLKGEFQRCRPYQAYWLLQGGDMRSKKVQQTFSGQSPAIPSGHAWLAFYWLICCLAKGLPKHVVPKSLQQACVDIGDRRVFAWVHYPSDSLASWYGALQLANESIGVTQIIKTKLKESLQQSSVWQEVSKTTEFAAAVREVCELLN
jgi:hypothetical protein